MAAMDGMGRGGNPSNVHVLSCHASVSGNPGRADVPAGTLGVASGDGVYVQGLSTARCGRDSSSGDEQWRKPRISGRDAKRAAASGVTQSPTPVLPGHGCGMRLTAGSGCAQGQGGTPARTEGNLLQCRHPHLSPGFGRKSIP